MNEIIKTINNAPAYVKRTCISMITNGKCFKDTLHMTQRLKEETTVPISILISPTLLNKQDLVDMKEAGADKIGIAIDLATPELFDQFRGSGVGGPHRWDKYMETIDDGLDIFALHHVGAHLMVGMGESEEDMVRLMDQLWQMGVVSHLFSFFAEKGSQMMDRPQAPWPTYLRIQLARYLIEEGLSGFGNMAFDCKGHIADFGVSPDQLRPIINSGTPFMTTGCLGNNGLVACNRPFGNCLPDIKQWNYPYSPNDEETALISMNIFKIED